MQYLPAGAKKPTFADMHQLQNTAILLILNKINKL